MRVNSLESKLCVSTQEGELETSSEEIKWSFTDRNTQKEVGVARTEFGVEIAKLMDCCFLVQCWWVCEVLVVLVGVSSRISTRRVRLTTTLRMTPSFH